MEKPNCYKIYNDDALNILSKFHASSIDSLVTDPPAGIGLLNLEWDDDKGGRGEWVKWMTQIFVECHRVLKPGAHGFVWALPRTSHWSATALEDAGFRIKDIVTHVFGTGFPKNMAVDKAIDRARSTDTSELYKVTEWIRLRRTELGLTNADLDRAADVRGGACHWTARPPNGQPAIPTLERWEKLEKLLGPAPDWMQPLIKPAYQLGEAWKGRDVVGYYEKDGGGVGTKRFETKTKEVTVTKNPLAQKWIGWGTALKPASEHWILVQKPFDQHNLAANILKHGTGAININASRTPTTDNIASRVNLDLKKGSIFSENKERSSESVYSPHSQGRFPTNFILSRSHGDDCPIQILNEQSAQNPSRFFKVFETEPPFFYCPKPSRSEKGDANVHPTVKPIGLMKYLIQMITPASGTVLDPFTGSGTTGIAALRGGFNFVGIEKDPSYFQLIQERLNQFQDSAA